MSVAHKGNFQWLEEMVALNCEHFVYEQYIMDNGTIYNILVLFVIETQVLFS